MSNKTQLQTNNTNLDTLITRVNAAKDVAASLPEAGPEGDESSNIDGWSGVIEKAGVLGSAGRYVVHYVDSTLTHNWFMMETNGSYDIEIAAGTFITCLSCEGNDIWTATGEQLRAYIYKPENNNFEIYIT